MTHTEEMHRQILGCSGAKEDHDWVLVTDGSGTDGPQTATGSAWLLRSMALQRDEGEVEMKGVAGATFGSVQRSEHMALLEGLRAISVLMRLSTLKEVEKFTNIVPLRRIEDVPLQRRPKVWWIGDRENLILQVARRPSGDTFYERRTEPDLWYALYWYEHLFNITPVYQPRNSTPDQVDVDARAGQTRKLFLPTT